jgi:hypothetical protein
MNALTLQTDLTATMWLIFDVLWRIRSGPIADMARMTWDQLQSWFVKTAEVEKNWRWEWQDGDKPPIDFSVSAQPTSLHIPLHRMFAALCQHLALRKDAPISEVYDELGLQSVNRIHALEHPLRCMVFRAQVVLGMWRRNGEAVEQEARFYQANMFHHLMFDLDLTLIRHVALSIPTVALLEITLTRFEVPATLDCSADLEFLPGRLQSWLLLLAHLLAYHSPLSMPVEDWTRHTLIQQLSHGPRTRSQLQDHKMDRLSTSTSQRDNTRMQNNLADVATFEVTGSRGTAKYKLKDELHVQARRPLACWMWITCY